MDWLTIISSVSTSIGITAAGAWWLGRSWITHKLETELEKSKGDIKKEVETALADRAAQRDYEFSAKQRLYLAIGSLKFQLLISCRDMAKHINTHGNANVLYSLDRDDYYGKSTLYRIIHPLVIVTLIEKQVAVADFSVDPEAIDLLRFKKSAFRAYKSDKVILNHPDERWGEQQQHLFHHSISNIVDTMIVADSTIGYRPMSYGEFEELLLDDLRAEPILPLINIVAGFSINEKPIFWLRLVFLAYIAADLVNKLGVKTGFKKIDIDFKKLICLSKDTYIQNNSDEIIENYLSLSSEGL
jgi:hypothetical protein